MSLFSPSDIATTKAAPAAAVYRRGTPVHRCVGKPQDILSKHVNTLMPNEEIHFWSFGRFAQHDLLFYLLRQTGPAHVEVATWSICTEAMERIPRLVSDGTILTIRFILDPRVKVRNPLPLQILIKNFPYVLAPCHAKVTLIHNEDWNVSVITSQNMTRNPRMERGVISTYPEIFKFDKEVFDESFR